jgi:hypothetical protein
MVSCRPIVLSALCWFVCAGTATAVFAQAPEAAAAPAWQYMQDGVVFAELNHQGGPQGGTEFVVPQWWMGMASHRAGKGVMTLTGMLSLDAATLGKDGYREIFQVGETLDGVPLIDHQHPHDVFMQLAVGWRVLLGESSTLTLSGGPSGEPALGPVAFMHRPSASENPLAPLSHHVFDSTHISFGVVTAAVERGRWAVEGSVFNGREPDERRWNFDFGPLDSVSARVWFKPTNRWELQASTGHLREPEQLEPGNVQRTTTSASWLRRVGEDYLAVALGYGVNATDHGLQHAVFGEVTRHTGRNSLYARTEVVQVETAVLQSCCDVPAAAEGVRDPVGAFTFGAVRDVLRWGGFEGGVGSAVTFYAVPDTLTSTHGAHPVSFQLFFRLRPPTAGGMGRMWNMRMSRPMAGHM